MPKQYRNITDEPLNVPLIGRTVQPGETVDVPKDLDYLDWDDVHWAEVHGSFDKKAK